MNEIVFAGVLGIVLGILGAVVLRFQPILCVPLAFLFLLGFIEVAGPSFIDRWAIAIYMATFFTIPVVATYLADVQERRSEGIQKECEE